MRIAIVNDMVMVVELLKRIILSADHQVAWVAYDGAEAVYRCSQDTPDLILMDLLMPTMDGVEATRYIMKNNPCAILVVTGSVQGNLGKVFEAMGNGALDTAKTPALDASMKTAETRELLQKIETIARLVGKGLQPKAATAVSTESVAEAKPTHRHPPLIALGASTGGPLALLRILSQLPEDFPAAFVVVQHVDHHFTDGFVRWLGGHCQLRVEIAVEGGELKRGVVAVAASSDHLVLSNQFTFHYQKHPEKNPYRPSVDVFFESVAGKYPTHGVGVLLTGMGRDGAKGLLSLREAGWHTIAQHRESCVVYGMPKAAIELEAATEVVPLDEIAGRLISIVCPQKKLVGITHDSARN